MTTAICTQHQGHILFTSLIVLVLMSLLGISIFNSGWLESRMSASWRKDARNFQHLELGLRIAETTVLPGIDPLDPGPWIVTIDPTDMVTTSAYHQPTTPLSVSVFRLPGGTARRLGLGGQRSTDASRSQRYRIIVSLGDEIEIGRQSLQAISAMSPGVRP